jgi:hypothetical protein
MLMDILKGLLGGNQNTQKEEETVSVPPTANSQQPWQFTHQFDELDVPQALPSQGNSANAFVIPNPPVGMNSVLPNPSIKYPYTGSTERREIPQRKRGLLFKKQTDETKVRQQIRSPQHLPTFPSGGQRLPEGSAGRQIPRFAQSQGIARRGIPANTPYPNFIRPNFSAHGGFGVQHGSQHRSANIWGNPLAPSRSIKQLGLPGGRGPFRPVPSIPQQRVLYGRLPQRSPHGQLRQHPGHW